MRCPCGSDGTYEDCCGRLHSQSAIASTAVELMRSRYAAYCRGELDYLVETRHPEKRLPDERDRVARSNKNTCWMGLEILDAVDGSEKDGAGTVSFEAYFRTPDGPGVLRERSRFSRVDGAWFYVDGEVSGSGAQARRNGPCPCDSGRKFKKCCGA